MGSSSQGCQYCGESPCACDGTDQEPKIVATIQNPCGYKHPLHGVPVELESGAHASWCGCEACHKALHARLEVKAAMDDSKLTQPDRMPSPKTELRDFVERRVAITGSEEITAEGLTIKDEADWPPILEPWPSEEDIEADADKKIADMVRASTNQKDPWKHRSEGMVCATCMWCAAKGDGQPDLTKKQLARCRRRAPTMNGYPVVFSNDWCGDHKLDESKL